MSWQPEVDELKRRIEMSKAIGGPENTARQHANGRLTVRERIERLIDPNPFHEVGGGSLLTRQLESEVHDVQPIVIGTYTANYQDRGALEK